MNARELMNKAIAQARRFGWPGLVGVIALLAAAVCVVLAQGWDAQTETLQSRADALHLQVLKATAATPQRSDTPGAPLDAKDWLAALPTASLRQERLADLLELAIKNGLVSARTDYHLNVDTGLGLEHLRVNMPVSGRYPQLRAFIEAALAHDPGLSLDSLKLQRATPQSDQVDAELTWSLHGSLHARTGGAS